MLRNVNLCICQRTPMPDDSLQKKLASSHKTASMKLPCVIYVGPDTSSRAPSPMPRSPIGRSSSVPSKARSKKSWVLKLRRPRSPQITSRGQGDELSEQALLSPRNSPLRFYGQAHLFELPKQHTGLQTFERLAFTRKLRSKDREGGFHCSRPCRLFLRLLRILRLLRLLRPLRPLPHAADASVDFCGFS